MIYEKSVNYLCYAVNITKKTVFRSEIFFLKKPSFKQFLKQTKNIKIKTGLKRFFFSFKLFFFYNYALEP